MSLEVDQVAAVVVGRCVPEVIEADVVQRRRRLEARDVTAELRRFLVRAQDDRNRVPANDRPDPMLDVAISGKRDLLLRRYRVLVRRGQGGRSEQPAATRCIEQVTEDEIGAFRTAHDGNRFQRFEPFSGFEGIEVAMEFHRHLLVVDLGICSGGGQCAAECRRSQACLLAGVSRTVGAGTADRKGRCFVARPSPVRSQERASSIRTICRILVRVFQLRTTFVTRACRRQDSDSRPAPMACAPCGQHAVRGSVEQDFGIGNHAFLHIHSKIMNLRQLRYFCEVVETGSAVRAARRLFVAQTAISMQLAQLEETLGGALFDRSRRPMELTALGKFFYPRARELLIEDRRLEEEARGLAAGKRGWIGVGFVRSVIYSVLPQAVRAFRETYPDVQLDLVELLSEHQPAQLRSGRLHLGISRFIGSYDQPADLRYIDLFEDPFVAVLPRDSPLARKRSVKLAELGAMPFISYPKDPQTPFALQVLAMLHTAGIKPTIAYETIEISTAFALVASGVGFALTGKSVTNHNRTDVAFVPVSDLKTRAKVVAVTRANEDSKLVASFVSTLRPAVRGGRGRR
jgi:DNA-binding transcriptional LysR family regulator